MIKKFTAAVISICIILCLCACSPADKPGKGNPVKLTIWHTYVEQMQNEFDILLDEFNATTGAKNGVTVEVTNVANSSVLNEQLIAAAKKDPGAPDLPDMAVVYPKVALELANLGVLADLDRLFSSADLEAFMPQFVDEGRLGGGPLYILPVGKSTEVLYLNKTVFDRFAAASGVNIGDLATFEGIISASEKYYKWTDEATPEIDNDGKCFYYPDGLFNFSLVGMEQMGGALIQNGGLNLTDALFKRIWESYYPSAVRGSVAIFNDYGNYLCQTGEIVCTTSTSAGASFYPHSVTYPDNTKEDVVFDVLPYPVFENGKKTAVQRGGGLCLATNDPLRMNAAKIFMKWFTNPAQNVRFTSITGYMPVTKDAYTHITNGDMPEIKDETVKKAIEVTAQMQKDYEFFFPPVFKGIDSLQNDYVENMQNAARASRDAYLSGLKKTGADAAYTAAMNGALDAFIAEMRK